MPTWQMYMFQNGNSPYADNLNSFHNYTMMMLSLIVVITLFSLLHIIFNVFTNRFLLKNHIIEIIWTVVPMGMLMIICVPSLKTLYMIDELNNPTYMTIKSMGHQWYWVYEYPEFNLEYTSYMAMMMDGNGYYVDANNNQDEYVDLNNNEEQMLNLNEILIVHEELDDQNVVNDIARNLVQNAEQIIDQNMQLINQEINQQINIEQNNQGEAAGAAHNNDPGIAAGNNEHEENKENKQLNDKKKNNLNFSDFIKKKIKHLNNFLIRLLDVDNRMVIPYGFPIRLLTSSNDVIHSWTVPCLGIKMDSTPGRINQGNLLATRPGIFFGQCSEICGTNHSFMPIGVESTSFKNFMMWIMSLINQL